MLCLTEEEMIHKEFLAYITEFLISEEVMHLFTIEEETTILNSIRTQVVQSGLVYSRDTAWEFFVKYAILYLILKISILFSKYII